MQLFFTIEGHPAAVLQYGNHAADRRITLHAGTIARWSADRWLGCEHHAAQTTAQFLEIVDLGPHGGLAHQPHHYPRPVRFVEGPFFALRAGIARLERLVTHLDLLGARVGVGPVATVTLGLGRHGSVALRTGFGVDFRAGFRRWLRGIVWVADQRSFRILPAANHRGRLFRLGAEEQLSQASDRGVLVAHQVGQAGVGIGQRLHQPCPCETTIT